MNRFASGSHLTGHPRCVQLTANAVNSPLGSRRSHAAVSAVTPAHAIGEGSRNETSTVLPTAKVSALPIGRQISGNLLINGPMRNPTIGTATSAAAKPISPSERRTTNARRSGLRGASPAGAGARFSASLVMHQFSNPARKRERDQDQPDGGKSVRGHESERSERDAQRHHRGLLGRREHALGLGRGPSVSYFS